MRQAGVRGTDQATMKSPSTAKWVSTGIVDLILTEVLEYKVGNRCG